MTSYCVFEVVVLFFALSLLFISLSQSFSFTSCVFEALLRVVYVKYCSSTILFFAEVTFPNRR